MDPNCHVFPRPAMSNRKPLAFILAGIAMLMLATPSSAAARAKKTVPGYGGAFGSASEARAQRSQRVKRPPACAYPVSYDSEGVAIFNTLGCKMD
jgi:hypothetical protein